MRVRAVAAVWILVLLASRHACATQQSLNFDAMAPDERRIMEHLLNDWNEDYSVTSVDLAVQSLGLNASAELRFRVGSYIKTHPELHEVIRRWGWQTLVLTPDEKLVARAIINPIRDKRKALTAAEISRQAGISQEATREAIETLARYGILKRDKSVGGVGYAPADNRYRNWDPWLDFQFHTVALDDRRLFNTN